MLFTVNKSSFIFSSVSGDVFYMQLLQARSKSNLFVKRKNSLRAMLECVICYNVLRQGF